jgi:hypothetical protein
MDTIVAEKIAQRNAEIGDNLIENNNISPEKWLKPIETSLDKNKKVSWNEPSINANNNNNNNIFNKLKQYHEQKSAPLPQVTTISNEQASKILSINNLPREPILTPTEIIKQLNETNKRIDTLQEMLVNITNIVEKMNTNTNANTTL